MPFFCGCLLLMIITVCIVCVCVCVCKCVAKCAGTPAVAAVCERVCSAVCATGVLGQQSCCYPINSAAAGHTGATQRTLGNSRPYWSHFHSTSSLLLVHCCTVLYLCVCVCVYQATKMERLGGYWTERHRINIGRLKKQTAVLWNLNADGELTIQATDWIIKEKRSISRYREQ